MESENPLQSTTELSDIVTSVSLLTQKSSLNYQTWQID